MLEENSQTDILIDIDDNRWLEWYSPDQWHSLIHKIVAQVIENVRLRFKVEVSFLLTNNNEIQKLNHQYRHKDKPTNVLSFPNLLEEEINKISANMAYPVMLGDIVLAFETILEESKSENKTFLDHFYHLVVHGMLHLLGYDHENDSDAECMQQKEVSILQDLSVNNPYQ